MDSERSIKTFSSGVGFGDAKQDDRALNKAIEWANNAGGNVCIRYPAGKYKHSDIATPILAPRVSIVGASKESVYLDLSASTGTFLQWGDPSLPVSSEGTDGSFSGFTVDWGSGATPGAVFAKIANYHRVEFWNNYFSFFPQLLYLGESAAKQATGTKVVGCRGFSANKGDAAFRLRFGAGLYLSGGCNFYVPVPPPGPGELMATAPNTNLFRCDEGAWDTVNVDGGVYERFYIAFAVTAFPGNVYLNFYVNGAVFDWCRYTTVYLESRSGGTISGFGMNGGWAVSNEAHNVQIVGDGHNDDHSIIGVQMPVAGGSQVSYANPSARSNIFANNRLAGDNRSGTAVAAIHGVSGKGLHAYNNVGTTACPYGVYVAPECIDCATTNNHIGR